MKSIKLVVIVCFFTLFSCKEQKLKAQKTIDGQQQEIAKIEAVDFKAKIEGKPFQLIDVRTPEEYNEGHIASAKNINFYDTNFLKLLEKLDKSKPVFLYCKSGGRSGKASARLRDAGFKSIYDLKGGFVAWQNAGFSVEH